MSVTLSLDHIILPKDVTDGFYSTWHTYYAELFPSPVKPKYRPMSKVLPSDDDNDVITQSSPNIFMNMTTTSSNNPLQRIANTPRVGDNIDEFIRQNRKHILTKSNSLNDIIQSLSVANHEFDMNSTPIISTPKTVTRNTKKGGEYCKEQKRLSDNDHKDIAEKYNVKLRSKSDLSQYNVKKSNRFSWCGSQTMKFFSSFQGKKKTYQCMHASDVFNRHHQQVTYDFNSNGLDGEVAARKTTN